MERKVVAIILLEILIVVMLVRCCASDGAIIKVLHHTWYKTSRPPHYSHIKPSPHPRLEEIPFIFYTFPFFIGRFSLLQRQHVRVIY